MSDCVCVHCGQDMDDEQDFVDATYSNINTSRARSGQHTGNIYKCGKCGGLTIDDFLCREQRSWDY